jgi:hypothetical protein
MEILGYVMTGIVAFLMCIQAKQWLLSFVPGTFIGACATFAGQGDWRLVVPSLALGLVFGYAMKNSGLWLASRRENRISPTLTSNKKREVILTLFYASIRIPEVPTYGGISPECRYQLAFLSCKSHNPRSIPSLIRKITPVSMADIRQIMTGSLEV